MGDFGVARLAGGTSQGSLVTIGGTPRYMSPEQARGRPTTAATDVYSAGIVLYEMLAGEPPFMDGSAVELGLRHLQDSPPTLPSHVPPALRQIAETALAKAPAERYGDGAEMAAALADAAEAGRQAPALPPAAAQETAATVAGRAAPDPAEALTLARAGARTRVQPRRGPAREPLAPDGTGGGRRPRRRPLAVVATLLLAGGAAVAFLLTHRTPQTTVPVLRGCPAAASRRGRGASTSSPCSASAIPQRPTGSRSPRAPARGPGSPKDPRSMSCSARGRRR